MKSRIWIAFTVILTVATLVGGLLTLRRVHVDVRSTAKHEFVIDESMPRVRKILVRTNAAKKIVAMADAELLDQDWLNLKFEMERPLLARDRDWNLNGNGEMVVQFHDGYLGSHQLALLQSIEIVPEQLEVSNGLREPSGPIEEYRSQIKLVPDGKGRAKFQTSLALRIKTTANWLTQRTVERNINQSAAQSLRNQEQAIREVVQEHANELLILPEFDRDESTN